MASLRFARLRHRNGSYYPTMVAGVQRVGARGVVAILRTFLAEDGQGKADVDPAKMMLGPTRGGAVRLARVDDRIVVGEGIESTLSVQIATGIPAWAALSAVGIETLELPSLPRASEVIIAADHDVRGIQAAENAASRWTREGRTVRIALPPEAGLDFNDVLMRAVAA